MGGGADENSRPFHRLSLCQLPMRWKAGALTARGALYMRGCADNAISAAAGLCVVVYVF